MKIIRLLKSLVTPKIQGTQPASRKLAAAAPLATDEDVLKQDDDEDSYRRSAYN